MDQIKVLLVDDEERFLKTTAKLLQKKGFAVQTAGNGLEALDILKQESIHVTLLDVKMPIMDGLETLKIAKQRHPLVEMIMLTGHATVEAAMDGLKSGAFDYIMKPADIDELVLKIKDAHAKHLLQTQKRNELEKAKRD
ncbi:response regulator [bacterium]|nr:response regulator [bacterium]